MANKPHHTSPASSDAFDARVPGEEHDSAPAIHPPRVALDEGLDEYPIHPGAVSGAAGLDGSALYGTYFNHKAWITLGFIALLAFSMFMGLQFLEATYDTSAGVENVFPQSELSNISMCVLNRNPSIDHIIVRKIFLFTVIFAWFAGAIAASLTTLVVLHMMKYLGLGLHEATFETSVGFEPFKFVTKFIFRPQDAT